MASRQAAKSKIFTPSPEDEEPVRISGYLSAKDAVKFKVKCATVSKSQSDVLRELVDAWLKT